MSFRKRPTEVSWDSDDDLLKDQPSVSAFPENNLEDDIDGIDVDKLLGSDNEDDFDEESATGTNTEKGQKQEAPVSSKKMGDDAFSTTKKTTIYSKKSTAIHTPAKSDVKSRLSLKSKNEINSGNIRKPDSGNKVDSGKKSTLPKSNTKNFAKSEKTKVKIEPIVFNEPELEIPQEEVLLLDADESLDFGYEDTDNFNESITDGTSSQFSSQDEPMTNFVVTATVEEVSEHDASALESTFEDVLQTERDSSEESDSDGEDGRRGRFKTERNNIITIKTSKPERDAIPDTLEISQEQQAEIDEFFQHGKGGRQRGRGRGQGRGHSMASRLGPRQGSQPSYNQHGHPPHHTVDSRQQHYPSQQQQQHPQMQASIAAQQHPPQSQPSSLRPRNIHINPRFRPPAPSQSLAQEMVPPQPLPGQPMYSAASLAPPVPQPIMQQPIRMPLHVNQPPQQVERWSAPSNGPPPQQQPHSLFQQQHPPYQQRPVSQPYQVPNFPPSSTQHMNQGPPRHLMQAQVRPHHQGQPMQSLLAGQGQHPQHGPPQGLQPRPFYQGAAPVQRGGPQPLLQLQQRPPAQMIQERMPSHYHGGPHNQHQPPQNNYHPPPQQHFQPRQNALPPQQPPPLMGQSLRGGQFRGPAQQQFPQQQRFQQTRGQPHMHQDQRQQFRQQSSFQEPPRHQSATRHQFQARPGQQQQRQQRPRPGVTDNEKAIRQAHTKKLQERARKFQQNKLQQGQQIQVIGSRPQKRPSTEISTADQSSAVKQIKQEPTRPLSTSTIEVDPETKKKLDEQKAMRERIRKQKEANRQKDAEKRKKELEERLAKEGKTLADIENKTKATQQNPAVGQLQAGPIKRPSQGPNNLIQGQGQKFTQLQKANQNIIKMGKKLNTQPQLLNNQQRGLKRNINASQGQMLTEPSTTKLMKKVTTIRKNAAGEIIHSETKMVPIDSNQVKGQQGTVVSNNPSGNKKIILRKTSVTNTTDPQQNSQNRSVVLKGQGVGSKSQRKVVSQQTNADSTGRRVVMSGDNKPKKVVIRNLSASTSESHVQHICSVVGPVETIELNKALKQATVTFLQGTHAFQFQKKYNRQMVDLSHITVDLLNI